MRHLIASAACVGLTLAGTAFLPSPAPACEVHELGLPESASTNGVLAQFLLDTKEMTREQRIQASRALSAADRQALRAEVAALSPDERKALNLGHRRNLTKAQQRAARAAAKAAAAQEATAQEATAQEAASRKTAAEEADADSTADAATSDPSTAPTQEPQS